MKRSLVETSCKLFELHLQPCEKIIVEGKAIIERLFMEHRPTIPSVRKDPLESGAQGPRGM
jgi:hypothetical protein